MTVIAAAITVTHTVALGTFGGLGIHLDISYSCNFEMMTPSLGVHPLNSTEKRYVVVIRSVTSNENVLHCFQCKLNPPKNSYFKNLGASAPPF